MVKRQDCGDVLQPREEQRLVYFGRLLQDHLLLKDVLRKVPGEGVTLTLDLSMCLSKKKRSTLKKESLAFDSWISVPVSPCIETNWVIDWWLICEELLLLNVFDLWCVLTVLLLSCWKLYLFLSCFLFLCFVLYLFITHFFSSSQHMCVTLLAVSTLILPYFVPPSRTTTTPCTWSAPLEAPRPPQTLSTTLLSCSSPV